MPEPALHFSVIFALSVPRLGIKKAVLLSSLALLPDLDIILYVHRSMSHSIILLSAAYLPILLAIFILKRRYFRLALLGFLAILSHPLMDCFQTYTPILYPVIDRSLWIKVNGWINISSEGFKSQTSINIKDAPTVFKPLESLDAPIFTSDGFIISLLLTAIPLLLEAKDSEKARKFIKQVSAIFKRFIEKAN